MNEKERIDILKLMREEPVKRMATKTPPVSSGGSSEESVPKP